MKVKIFLIILLFFVVTQTVEKKSAWVKDKKVIEEIEKEKAIFEKKKTILTEGECKGTGDNSQCSGCRLCFYDYTAKKYSCQEPCNVPEDCKKLGLPNYTCLDQDGRYDARTQEHTGNCPKGSSDIGGGPPYTFSSICGPHVPEGGDCAYNYECDGTMLCFDNGCKLRCGPTKGKTEYECPEGYNCIKDKTTVKEDNKTWGYCKKYAKL